MGRQADLFFYGMAHLQIALQYGHRDVTFEYEGKNYRASLDNNGLPKVDEIELTLLERFRRWRRGEPEIQVHRFDFRDMPAEDSKKGE